jgi:hypothetical protein
VSVKRADRRNRVEQINLKLNADVRALRQRVESLTEELGRTAHGAMHDVCDDLADTAALADDGWASLDLDEKKQLLTTALQGSSDAGDGDDNEPPKTGKKK